MKRRKINKLIPVPSAKKLYLKFKAYSKKYLKKKIIIVPELPAKRINID